MDGDVIAWLLFIAVWFISSIVQQIRKMGKNVPGSEPRPQHSRRERPQERQSRPPVPPPPRPQELQARELQAPEMEPMTLEAPELEKKELPPPPLADSPDPVRDLMRRLGVDLTELTGEQPVASEHRRTAGEHSQDPWQVEQTPGETLITSSEHRHTASEVRRTASEHRQDPSEIRGTRSEHLRGDVAIAPKRRRSAAATVVRKHSRVGASVHKDLRRGPAALRRAFVLKEVLDTPVGLRREPPR